MKRIQEIDALRGFALFGILLVNVFVFHAPLSYYSEFYGSFEGLQADAVDVVVNFAGGKFLFIFAFLFGFGIELQKTSWATKFRTHFTKRMLVLLVFGLAHLLLFWFGDILASYALLGLLMLPFLNLSSRWILSLAAFFIFFRSIYYFGVVVFGWPQIAMGKPEDMDTFMSVFQHGTYFDIFQLRMREFFAFMPENLVWYIPKTFGLFFVGVYSARIGLFSRLRGNRSKFIIAFGVLFFISVFWITVKYGFFSLFDFKSAPIWRPILIGVNVFFETCLGLSYVLGFGMLFQSNNPITRLFARTGKLALSNYILQSFLCVGIFYGYGLGYYGKLRPTDLILITLSIFAINLIFSYIYMKYWSVGPLEHLWRKWVGAKK